MGRRILSVFLGLLVASAIFLCFEGASTSIFPPPNGLDLSDPEALKAFISQLPAGAFALVLVGHAVGTFFGGFTLRKISKQPARQLALVLGGVLTLAAIMNLYMIPHPTWFMVLNLAIYVPMAALGERMGAPLRRG